MSVLLLALSFVVAAVVAAPADAELSNGWQPPPEGAAQLLLQGDRVFAVGAQSGGAGTAATDDPAHLQPSPGGTPIPDSRCAMVVGQCAGGECIYDTGFFCKQSDCSGRKFC